MIMARFDAAGEWILEVNAEGAKVTQVATGEVALERKCKCGFVGGAWEAAFASSQPAVLALARKDGKVDVFTAGLPCQFVSQIELLPSLSSIAIDGSAESVKIVGAAADEPKVASVTLKREGATVAKDGEKEATKVDKKGVVAVAAQNGQVFAVGNALMKLFDTEVKAKLAAPQNCGAVDFCDGKVLVVEGKQARVFSVDTMEAEPSVLACEAEIANAQLVRIGKHLVAAVTVGEHVMLWKVGDKVAVSPDATVTLPAGESAPAIGVSGERLLIRIGDVFEKLAVLDGGALRSKDLAKIRAGSAPAAEMAKGDGKMSLVPNVRQALMSKSHAEIMQLVNRQDRRQIIQTADELRAPEAYDFIQLLTTVLQNQPGKATEVCVWLKHLLESHAPYIISMPHLRAGLEPLYQTIASRSSNYNSLLLMAGKLQSTNAAFFADVRMAKKDEEDMREPLIRYQEDDEMLDAASEEEPAAGDQEMEMGDGSDMDDEMFDLDEDSDFEEF